MRKLFISMLVLLLISAGAAFAQEDQDVDAEDLSVTPMEDALGTSQYAGASLGFPLLQGYFGLEQAAFGGDLRFRLGLQPLFGFSFSGGADVLFDISKFGNDSEFTAYAGGGPGLSYIGGSIGGVGYNFFGIDLTGVGGVNYRLDPGISLFGEAGLGFGFGFGGGTIAGTSYGGLYIPIRLGLGANFHF